jgi:hypothetical protein
MAARRLARQAASDAGIAPRNAGEKAAPGWPRKTGEPKEAGGGIRRLPQHDAVGQASAVDDFADP